MTTSTPGADLTDTIAQAGLRVLPPAGLSRDQLLDFANDISLAAHIAAKGSQVRHDGGQALTDELQKAWNADPFSAAVWDQRP